MYYMKSYQRILKQRDLSLNIIEPYKQSQFSQCKSTNLIYKKSTEINTSTPIQYHLFIYLYKKIRNSKYQSTKVCIRISFEPQSTS